MKKKGFTLIELLAIIVILAIIALIAVPVVLNIIDKAKVSSYKRSSENVLESARLYFNGSYLDKTTDLSGNKYDEIIDTLSGDKPDSGQIYIKEDGSIAMLLKYGENCYIKSYEDSTITHSDGDVCSSNEKEFTNDRVLELVTEKYNETKEVEGIYDAIIEYFGEEKFTVADVKINEEEKLAIALGYTDACYVKNYDEDSFSIKELEEGQTCAITPTEPAISYKCIRASVLHTETCKQSGSCDSAGYTTDVSKLTTTITYGNEEITEGELNSGDAFDCDVDGTGYNHRFYYVTEFTSNNEEYAVLVYYNNTTNGVADNSSSGLVAYDSRNENWHGPVDAINNLPTTKQWSNISLSSTTRAITTDTGTTTTHRETLPTAFSYTKTVNGETVPLAARLLTYQEIATACGGDGNPTSSGELDGCNYLMENTKYSNNSLGTYGYWLETPRASDSFTYACYVLSDSRVVSYGYTNKTDRHGARPAIEVLKTEISY